MTSGFWRHFPDANGHPIAHYVAHIDADHVRIAGPEGALTCLADDAPRVWDWVQRRALLRHLGPGVLHGALIVLDDFGILVSGETGHGKSTLVKGLIERPGYRYGGDEHVRLRPEGLLGVPRCLEGLPSEPWQTGADNWTIATAYRGSVGHFHAWHAESRLYRQVVPWRRILALVTLGDRQNEASWQELQGLPGTIWQRQPHWTQLRRTARLAALPRFRFDPPEGIDAMLDAFDVAIRGWRRQRQDQQPQAAV